MSAAPVVAMLEAILSRRAELTEDEAEVIERERAAIDDGSWPSRHAFRLDIYPIADRLGVPRG